MVIQCDRDCEGHCHNKRVYICLNSEREFLSSLLKLGADTNNKNGGVIDHDPTELIDWYLYAKRSYSSRPNEDRFTWGIKLLDELGKILFSLTQVTARYAKENGASRFQCDEARKLLLLRPLEQLLVEAFLPSSSAYENLQENNISSPPEKYSRVRDSALGKKADVSNALDAQLDIKKLQEGYQDELECRIAFTKIQEIGVFFWEQFQSDVFLIRHQRDDDLESQTYYSNQLNIACAYLHGVARFAFVNLNHKQVHPENKRGYWLDECLSKVPLANEKYVSDEFSPSKQESVVDDEYAYIPSPKREDVQLSCELATSFAQEYWSSSGRPQSEVIFDVLFMCKDESGWFWVLTRSQFESLRVLWRDRTPQITHALKRFRFKHAGIINHLERTECLTEEVFEFTKEDFICTAVGYRLEDTRDVSADFEEFESSFPGVGQSSYFYFGITPRDHHEDDNDLPYGSLVAIFRFDRGLSAALKLQRMSLVRQLIERWRAKVASSGKVVSVFSKIIRPFQEKTARAAIMSRNFSHNVGSHSLGNPNLLNSIGIKRGEYGVQTDIEQRLSTFHSYAQGRLDFLARAISESGTRSKPVFFLNDVMESGFFRQGVLLDTLIEDLGFRGERIEFHVEIQMEEASKAFGLATYTWKENERRFVRGCDHGIQDAVVGMPGGMIGSHALYAFLENALRNAVKYGRTLNGSCEIKQDKLHIHLRLEQCKGLREDKPENAWVLSLWDNVSCDCDGRIAQQIRQHIIEPLIDEKGAMQTRGHGIQEMKICAELLSGGSAGLRFPADDGYGHDSRERRCKHCTESCNASQEYLGYRKLHGEEPIASQEALRCCSTPHAADEVKSSQDKSAHWLTYNLFMPIPVLLGVVQSSSRPAGPPHIRYYESVLELAKEGAHIGILLDEDGAYIDQTLNEIARLHPCLPFRLMVVTSHEKQWTEALDLRLHKDQPFDYPAHIPNRRLHICGGELGQKLKSLLSDSSGAASVEFLGAGGVGEKRWDAIVLLAYDAWLRVYKRLPDGANGQWKLCLGFEHGGTRVAQRWETPLKAAFRAKDNSCIGVHVVSLAHRNDTSTSPISSENFDRAALDREKLKQSVIDSEQKAALDQKIFLFFDNHGTVLSGFGGGDVFGAGARFYQKMGLQEGLTLMQSLESPPQSPFGFALFVYSLVEGALTNVVILDERVAQATLNRAGYLFEDTLHNYQCAGLFPLFNFRRVVDGKAESVAVSGRIETAATDTAAFWGNPDNERETPWTKVWTNGDAEGLHFETSRCSAVTVVKESDTRRKLHTIQDVDVLVIHEGVADRLNNMGIWEASTDARDTRSLFHAAPFVVRTSGRGRKSRHLHNILPFLEFTELSENTYRGMNKPDLVKALLSTSGDPRYGNDQGCDPL